MKLKLIIFLFPVIFLCEALNAQTSDENLTAKIETILQTHPFNGVVLVTNGEQVRYAKASGNADFEKGTLLKADDQFVIGSVSKQITAVLVMQAYEEGKIRLDDTIATYLSDIDQKWRDQITIHHLLTHTHGIVSLDEPLEFEAGSQFHYSQLGYDLLARILERVNGRSFQEQTTNLFAAHGLKNTFHPDQTTYQKLVKGYEEGVNGELVYQTNSLQNYAAAGSFISNATDLAKWNQLLYSAQLVKPETLELMSTRYATRVHPIFGKVEYGYGLLFTEGEAHIQLGALGFAPGFVTACYYYPQSSISLVVLENVARDIPDFKKTFSVHTELMELVKKESVALN